jgi:clan AA aspartic protease (TIGR02281 family)
MQKLAEKIKQKYDDLSDDASAKAAVEKLSKAIGKSYSLKESPSLLATLKSLKRLEDSVLSEQIDLRTDGSDLFTVSVMLNGKYVKELCLDSGSSLISLPYKMAREVGLNPDKSEDEIIVVLADGRRIKAKRMTLSKVRVGKFEVDNVICAVMPEDLTEAAALLGMSFLGNFNFKIDTENKKLTMTKIEGSGAGTASKKEGS